MDEGGVCSSVVIVARTTGQPINGPVMHSCVEKTSALGTPAVASTTAIADVGIAARATQGEVRA